MRSLTLVPLLALAVASACPAVEDEMPTLTRISDWLFLPAANLVVADDRLQIHPQAFVTAGWSAYRNETSSDDQGLSMGGVAGGEVRWSPVSDHMLLVHALGGASVSPLTQDLNPLRGRARAEWVYTGPVLTSHAEATIAYDGTDLVQAGLPYLRVQQRVEERLAIEGARTGILVRPWVERERFLEPGPFFSGSQRDSTTAGTEVRAQYALASRFYLWGAVEGRWIGYDDDGPYSDGRLARATAGLSLNPSDHIESRLGVGIAGWRFDDDWAGDPDADDRSALIPEGELSLAWTWRVRGRLGISLTRSSLPGLGSNVAVVDQAALRFNHPLPERWVLFCEGGPLRVRNVGRLADGPPEQRREWQAEVGAEYWLQRGILFRGYLRTNASRARYQEDFDRYAAGLQTIAVF